MRKILLLLCLFVTTVMMADPVTPIEAQKKAQAFLWQKNPTHVLRAMRRAQTLSQPSDEQAPLYIFNVGDDNGFVIVSGEDRTADILGYSDSGHIDTEDMPEGLRDLLDQYTNIINRISQDTNFKTSTQQSLHRISGKAPIAPLLECQWNQSAPYNTQCPVLPNGNNCAVGCVAVAMAQVMYYHQWPAQTIHEIGAYTSSMHSLDMDMESIPAGVTIDWNNIQPTYKKNTYNGTPSEDAIANLMKLCGRSIRMNYNTESGAYASDVMYALDTIFDYEEKTLNFLDRTNFSYEEWQNILYKELEELRPIVMQGSKFNSGHAFVCDGYDSEDLFHINWGWGGRSDGYYRLNAMKPGEEGIGGSSEDGGYTIYMGALTGIQKNDGVDDHTTCNVITRAIYLRDETTTYERNADGSFGPINIMYKISNPGEDITIDAGVLITDMQDNIIAVTDDPLVQNYLLLHNYYWYTVYEESEEGGMLDESVPVTIGKDLPDGRYKFVMGIRTPGTEDYIPCNPQKSKFYTFSISNDKLYFNLENSIHVIGDPKITGPLLNYNECTIEFEISNDGPLFCDNMCCKINPIYDEDNNIQGYDDLKLVKCVELEQGESTTVKFKYTPSKSGTHTFVFYWDSSNSKILTVPVEIAPSGKVNFSNGEISGYNEEYGGITSTTFTMSLIAENSGDGNYNGTATVYLLHYAENGTWYYCNDNNGTFHVNEEWEINLTPGEKETRTFSFDVENINQQHCLYVVYNQGEKSSAFWSADCLVLGSIGVTTFDIPNSDYSNDQNAYIVPGSTFALQIKLTNYSSTPYNATLNGRLIFEEEPNQWKFVNHDLAPIIEWEIKDLQPGESLIKTFSWENLEIGKTYKIYLGYPINGKDYYYWSENVILTDPTGIEALEAEPSNFTERGGLDDSGVLYNLSGQRVSKGYKGIVISKGKKYFVK